MEHSASQPQYFSAQPPQPPPGFQHAVNAAVTQALHHLQAYQPPQHQPLQQPQQTPPQQPPLQPCTPQAPAAAPQQQQRGYFTQEGGAAHHQPPQLSSSQAADLDAIEGLLSGGGQQSLESMQTDAPTDDEESRNSRAQLYRGRRDASNHRRSYSPERRRRPGQARRNGDSMPRPMRAPAGGTFYPQDDGSLVYKEDGHEDILFCRPKQPLGGKANKHATIISTNPVLIMGDIRGVDELPNPGCVTNCRSVKTNALMCLAPKLRRWAHGDDPCHCVPHTLPANHREAHLPSYCLVPRRGDPTPPKFRVPQQANWFYENVSRAFRFNETLQLHSLVVPQPYPISPRWKTRYFQPTFSGVRGNEPALEIFRNLSQWDDHVKLVEAYLAGPEDWEEWEHPFFSEPHHGQELSFMGRTAYGAEGLYRMGLVQHPARPKALLVPIAATKELETPVISTAYKFAIDEFICRRLRPFYKDGAGEVLCPVCLGIPDRRGQLMPMWLSKAAYIEHFQLDHWNTSFFTGLATPSQLGTRIYQAFIAYILCLANSPATEGPGSETEMSPILKKFINPNVSEFLPYVGGFGGSFCTPPTTGSPVNITVTNSATFAEMVTGSGTSTHVDQAVTVTQTAQGGAPATRGDSHGTGLETASQVCRNLGVPPKGGQVATTLAPAANNPGTKKKQR